MTEVVKGDDVNSGFSEGGTREAVQNGYILGSDGVDFFDLWRVQQFKQNLLTEFGVCTANYCYFRKGTGKGKWLVKG